MYRPCRTIIAAVCLSLCTCLNINAAFAQQRTVRVGVIDNPPTIFSTTDGKPAGIMGELLEAIAKEQNWQLQSIPCDLQSCLDALQTGHIDLLPNVAYSDARAHLYDFHPTPALRSWSQIYERPDGSIKSLFDLDGKRVSAVVSTPQYEYLASLPSDFGITPNLHSVGTLEDGFDMVADGKADAAVANHFFGARHAAQYGLVATSLIFQPSRLFYATKKGRNGLLLAAIERHLKAWQNTPGSVYYQILERWGEAKSTKTIPIYFWWTLGALGGLLALSMLISLLLKAQVARQTGHIKASETMLNTILDSVDAYIYIKDKNLRYLYGNRKLCELFKKSPQEVIGCSDSQFFDAKSCAAIRLPDLRVIEKGERVVLEEHNVTLDASSVATFLSIKIPLRNAEGEVEALCGISTDITEHRAAQQEVQRLAFYDALTELPNRRLLLENIDNALSIAKIESLVSALLYIDLDNFKRINDAHGHDVGDTVLRTVAQRLKNCVHTADTVARIGGDEFVILLDYVGRDVEEALPNAKRAAERVRAVLEEPIVLNQQDYLAGASIGLTLISPESASTADVMREADMAMYLSKRLGRNRVAIYEQSMHHEASERLLLESDLSHAIGTPQFEMHIQPQWNSTQHVMGAELLMRWNHPERGAISPDVFIPIAEQSGLILRLGDWALQQACMVLEQLRQAGELYPLSINLSPRQFRKTDFVERVQEVLAEYGTPADSLIFEVTEGVLIEDMQGTIERMAQLTALGVRFSIDDFGTGYSSLAYLKRLPLYELKIDESFMHDTPAKADDAAIVKLILAMAKQLHLQVVAEGVETREQADFLIENGCDAIQGFLFARPMSVNDWLSRKAA